MTDTPTIAFDVDRKVSAPPQLPNGTLRVYPLGGVGEVGRNMTVYEMDGKLLIVDCGVLFPEEEQPGVDLILPDMSHIEDRLDDVVAVVITHGHEDHIGAVPYLLRLKQDIPLVASQLTLALVEAKLQEHRIKPFTLQVREGDVEQFGPFEVEFAAVNHSIPDSMAVLVRTKAGNVFQTGDFKMDPLPLDGRVTDLRAFGRWGEEGVDLMVPDSTNAEVPGHTPTERNIQPVLDNAIAKAEQRVIVASFASHVHRVQQVVNAAAKAGRKICLVGRSMVRNMTIASKLGYLDIPEGMLVDFKNVDKIPDHQIVLMCTGSQGEPMAALSRMASGDHKISLDSGDTVILASSLIPGNETSVFRLMNALQYRGINVIHKGNANVHVSGHAYAGELLTVYNVVQPRHVMPVHGEPKHQLANAKLAHATGVPVENLLLANNGTVVDITDGVPSITGQLDVSYVYVDGTHVGMVTEDDLKDRMVLSKEGFVSVISVVDRKTQKIIQGPDIVVRGVAETAKTFEVIKPKIASALEEAMRDKPDHTQHQLQQVVRRVIGSWVGRKLRRRPMIVPVVVEV